MQTNHNPRQKKHNCELAQQLNGFDKYGKLRSEVFPIKKTSAMQIYYLQGKKNHN